MEGRREHRVAGRSVFGIVCKHQCFKSYVGSYMKPVEGTLQWADVGKGTQHHSESFSVLVHMASTAGSPQGLKMTRDSTS